MKEVEAPTISIQSALEDGDVVSLTHRPPLAPEDLSATLLYWRLSRLRGYSAAGMIKSTKNSHDPTGNRTRDLPPCSAVPQSTAPPLTPIKTRIRGISYIH